MFRIRKTHQRNSTEQFSLMVPLKPTMMPDKGSAETYTDKGGGFYFLAGSGGHFVSAINFAVGYEMMKPKSGDARSSVYFRFDLMDMRMRGRNHP